MIYSIMHINNILLSNKTNGHILDGKQFRIYSNMEVFTRIEIV